MTLTLVTWHSRVLAFFACYYARYNGARVRRRGGISRTCLPMDSEIQRDGRILDLVDDAWKEDKLPYEDVTIPLNELPEPEQDNGGVMESVKEQEMKWADLALQYLHENIPLSGN
ncbi:anaphase-promoting complex subunit 13 [Ranitomeya imitator]